MSNDPDRWITGAQAAALVGKSWPLVASVAGAVMSLAFLQNLTPRGRAVAVAVGFGTAVFAAPGIAEIANLFWPADAGAFPQALRNMIHFGVSLSAMGALPFLLQRVQKWAGDPMSLLKQTGAN